MMNDKYFKDAATLFAELARCHGTILATTTHWLIGAEESAPSLTAAKRKAKKHGITKVEELTEFWVEEWAGCEYVQRRYFITTEFHAV